MKKFYAWLCKKWLIWWYGLHPYDAETIVEENLKFDPEYVDAFLKAHHEAVQNGTLKEFLDSLQ